MYEFQLLRNINLCPPNRPYAGV